MGSFYTPNAHYDINTFTDNLPAYTSTEDLAGLLDQTREIIDTQSFFFQMMPFPAGALCYVPGYGTVSGNITVPPLCFMAAIMGDSFYTTTTDETHVKQHRNKEGFTIRIYDKGAKLDTVVNSLYMANFPNVGVMANIANPNQQTNHPIGPMFPQSPMVPLIPGNLQVELTNLAAVPVFMQIVFNFSVPVNNESKSQQLIGVGNNK
jgi:hypothetical protein